MAAGISDRLWSVEDIANLVETAAPKPGKRSLQASRRRNFKLRHYRRLTRIAAGLPAPQCRTSSRPGLKSSSLDGPRGATPGLYRHMPWRRQGRRGAPPVDRSAARVVPAQRRAGGDPRWRNRGARDLRRGNGRAREQGQGRDQSCSWHGFPPAGLQCRVWSSPPQGCSRAPLLPPGRPRRRRRDGGARASVRMAGLARQRQEATEAAA